MNVISSGENDVSWAALNEISLINQSLPFTSKYNWEDDISLAIIFSFIKVFWSSSLELPIFLIVCDVGESPNEPLRYTFK